MQSSTTSLRGTKQSLSLSSRPVSRDPEPRSLDSSLRWNDGDLLSDSFLGKLLQKFSFPLVSEFLILISIFLFWYEGAFPTYNLASVALVLALVFADKTKIKIGKSTIYLILFFLLALFSGVLAAWNGINPRLVLMGWALLGQFLVAILAAQGVPKPKRLVRNIVLISLPMIAVGAYQFIANQSTSRIWVSAAESSISTRAFAFFGSPNVLGVVLSIIALVSAGIFLDDFHKDSPFKRTVLKEAPMAFVAISALVVLVFTFSRSAWIGLAAGLFLVLIIKRSNLVLLTPLASLALLVSQVRDRLFVVFTSGFWFDSSIDGRLWAINNGFHIWTKYPLFGSGPGTYGGKLALNAASPVYLQGIQSGYVALYFTDNQWLQLLVQTGIIGILLFALFVVNVFAELISKYNEARSWTILGITGAFVAFLVAGFFGNVLEFGAIAVPIGVMIGIALSNDEGLMPNEEYGVTKRIEA